MNKRTIKLGEICSITSGQGAPQGDENYCIDGIPFVKAGNLFSLINGTKEQEIQCVSGEVIGSHRLRVYPAGSIVFAKSGASCLKGYVYVLKGDCCVVSHLAIVTPKSIEHCNSNYMGYYFRYHKPNKLVRDLAYPTISLTDLSDMDVIIDDIKEQNRIVAELDKIQEAIDNKRQQLAKLDELVNSKFYEMFGDPIANPKGWGTKKFPLCFKLSSGDALSAKNIVSGEFPVFGGNGIMGYHNKFNLEGENIIIGRVGALCGNVRLIREKIYATDNAFILSNLTSLINIFILHLLSHINLRQYAKEAAQPVISNISLKDVNIILPSLSLQEQFAEFAQKVEKAKDVVSKQIEHLQELLDSRMDFYFKQ